MGYTDKIKSKEKTYKFNMFGENLAQKSDDLEEFGKTKIAYNLVSLNGALKSGYGFSQLKMPSSETDLNNESVVNFKGNQIKAIWKLKWYDQNIDTNKYYLFYYNDEGYICYDNMFGQRLASFVIPNTFTQTPFAAYYRKGTQDALLLSGEGDSLMVLTGGSTEENENAPQIISCCVYGGKLFAITAEARATLIYTEELEIVNFSDEKTKDLDFGDERGDLQKLISFNDYLYIFRDYGITKLSIYGSNEDFAVNHLYHSDSYIYPNTIVLNGDDVYFFTTNGLKKFNGTSVSDIEIDYVKWIKGINQKNSCASIYDGKYYLACKANIDDKKVGCENNSEGYVNNILLVYDLSSGHADIIRGVDICNLLTLNNPFKTKLLANFNDAENYGKVGEIKQDGKIFEENLDKYWQSVKTDFGIYGKKKTIRSIVIKSLYDCEVTISCERGEKILSVKGDEKIQTIRVNLTGNEFDFSISSVGQVDISNFALNVSIRE